MRLYLYIMNVFAPCSGSLSVFFSFRMVSCKVEVEKDFWCRGCSILHNCEQPSISLLLQASKKTIVQVGIGH